MRHRPISLFRQTSGCRRHCLVVGADTAPTARTLLSLNVDRAECGRQPIGLDAMHFGGSPGRLFFVPATRTRTSARRADLDFAGRCFATVGRDWRHRLFLLDCGTVHLGLGELRTFAARGTIHPGTRVTLYAILALRTILAPGAIFALGALFTLGAILTLRTILALGALAVVLTVELELLALIFRVEVAALTLILFDARLVVVEDAEIMIGKLEIIFRIHPIALHLRVASKVPVLLQQLRGIATCATVDAIAVIRTARVSATLRALSTTTATAADLPVVYQRVCVPFKTVRRSCRSRMLPVAETRRCATPSAMATGPQWRA